MQKILALAALTLLVLAAPAKVTAHALGEHYIWLDVEASQLKGDVEINVRDLARLLGYNLDPEATITKEAIAPYSSQLEQYISERFSISTADGTLPMSVGPVSARSFEEGNFVMVRFTAGDGSTLGETVTVRDELFLDQNRQHRGILLIRSNLRTGDEFEEREALVFSSFSNEHELNLDDPPRLLTRLQFIWQGMLHIFVGIDHVLFLVVLLFTAVLVRKDQAWAPSESFNMAFWNVLKIVTLFTIAHSVTLFLAGLGYLRLPSRLVESIIALSIIVVAINNLIGRFDSKKLWIILAFGLFHGLGFASVMAELPFRMVNLLGVVLFFNVGVELGQIVIVAAVFPLLYAMRGSRFYVPGVVVGGSLVIAAIAGLWLVQRAFNLG